MKLKKRKLFMKLQRLLSRIPLNLKDQVQCLNDLKHKRCFQERSHFWIPSKSFNHKNENLHDQIHLNQSEIQLETLFKKIQRKPNQISLCWETTHPSSARLRRVLLFLLEEPTINKFTILFQETLTFMALLEPSQYRQELMVEMELDLTVS